MSEVLIAHPWDLDKIPANIRDGVEIDWVMGNMVDWWGSRWTVQIVSETDGWNDYHLHYYNRWKEYLIIGMYTDTLTRFYSLEERSWTDTSDRLCTMLGITKDSVLYSDHPVSALSYTNYYSIWWHRANSAVWNNIILIKST